jgi:hypothetical protein
MKKQILDLLRDDGLQNSPPLKPYIEALESIPYLNNIELGGQEFFAKVESVWF